MNPRTHLREMKELRRNHSVRKMPRINSLACQLAQLNTDSVLMSASSRRVTRQSNHFPIGLSTFVKIIPGNNYCLDCRFRREENPSDELLWAK